MSIKKEMNRLVVELFKLSGGSKAVVVLIVFVCIVIGLGISFLLAWPITLFINYMIFVLGGSVVLKVWQVWVAWGILQFMFKGRGERK